MTHLWGPIKIYRVQASGWKWNILFWQNLHMCSRKAEGFLDAFLVTTSDLSCFLARGAWAFPCCHKFFWSSLLSPTPWALLFGPWLLWQGRRGPWGNEVTSGSRVESGGWSRTAALPAPLSQGRSVLTWAEKTRDLERLSTRLFHPWPWHHMPLIKPDLNMFTSPSGPKSSGSLPPTPTSPRAFSPTIIIFFPTALFIWCQTSIYCTVLTRLEERVTSYLGAPAYRIGGTPFKDVNLLAIWKEAHLTKLPLCWNLEAFLWPHQAPARTTYCWPCDLALEAIWGGESFFCPCFFFSTLHFLQLLLHPVFQHTHWNRLVWQVNWPSSAKAHALKFFPF